MCVCVSPLSHAQLTRVSETSFDSVRVHMHIIRSFEIDIIRKNKMVAEDKVVVVILCFALVCSLRRQHTSAQCSESEGCSLSTTCL